MTYIKIRPSALPMIQHCPGSVVMQAQYPQEDSDDARAGTAAHWCLSEQLSGRMTAEGQVAPNGVVLTDEMLDGADLAVDYVRRVTKGMAGNLMIEQNVTAPRIHANCSGQLDIGAWLFPGSRRPHLFVADYKFGHRYVDAVENAQLIGYACGLLDATKYDDQIVDVTLAVVQPRCFAGPPIREWKVTAAELRGHINKLHMAADEATQTDPPVRVSQECVDCSARRACPAFQKDAYRSAQYSGTAVPFDLTPDQAGMELVWLKRAADRLKGRITGLEVQIESQLKDGQRVNGWRLESTAGREVWHNPAEAIELGETMGVPLARPATPITPAQARKAGIPDDVVAAYAGRPVGGVRLVVDEGSSSLAAIFAAAK